MNRTLRLLLSAPFALVACDQRAAIQNDTNDYTIGVSDVCNVHNRKMIKTPDKYALFALGQAYEDWCKVRRTKFPHTTGEHDNSPCTETDSTIMVYVCTKCERMKALERVKRNWKN
jgi:hypothetical protein